MIGSPVNPLGFPAAASNQWKATCSSAPAHPRIGTPKAGYLLENKRLHTPTTRATTAQEPNSFSCFPQSTTSNRTSRQQVIPEHHRNIPSVNPRAKGKSKLQYAAVRW